jgi:hypothetical protein
MFKRSLLAVGIAGALSCVAASAAAGEIELYEGRGFQGHSIVSGHALSDLQRTDFNDVAASVVVRDGTWEACTQPNFRGVCAELVPGQYANLDAQLNGAIVSTRQIAERTGAAHVVVAPDAVATAPSRVVVATPAPGTAVVTTPPRAVAATPAPDEPNVILYQHTNAGIRAVELRANIDDLRARNFAGSADAALVTGGTWRLCDDVGGRGNCAEYGPGQYVTLGPLNHRVASVYLVTPASRSVTVAPAVVSGRVVLYQNPNFNGPSAVVERGNAPDLDWARFTNPASSARVESGTWLVCSDLGYQGDCRVLGPGNYANLPGMTGIWSARQVWQPQYGAVELKSVR